MMMTAAAYKSPVLVGNITVTVAEIYARISPRPVLHLTAGPELVSLYVNFRTCIFITTGGQPLRIVLVAAEVAVLVFNRSAARFIVKD